ncbi:YgaP family membrane protein [Kaarinaea lacus]
MNKTNIENITNSDRVIRIAAGLGMVFSVTLQSGPIGVAAILPLFAIYPIMTGVVGWDPIVNLFSARKQQSDDNLKGTVANAS